MTRPAGPRQKLQTIAAVAADTDSSPRTVQRWIEAGLLPVVVIGGRGRGRKIRIRPEDVDRLIEQSTERGVE